MKFVGFFLDMNRQLYLRWQHTQLEDMKKNKDLHFEIVISLNSEACFRLVSLWPETR